MTRANHSPPSAHSRAKPELVDLIDMNSLREATEAFSGGEERVQPDFSALKEVIIRVRRDWRQKGWRDAELQIALASVDVKSEGQQRVVAAMERTFDTVDASYYRDNFISTPPGRSPNEMFDRDKGQRPMVALASRMAYAVGRLSCGSEPQVLVVTHAFELYYPLLQLRRSNPSARVGLAYFGSLLDQRWKFAGVTSAERENEIEFYDLDPLASDIFGGVDLMERRPAHQPKKSGLDLI